MKRWTKQAEARLDEYLGTRVLREGLTGPDARELVEDLRAHVQEEMEHREKSVVDTTELDAVLSAMDGDTETNPQRLEQPMKLRTFFTWAFGVFLPLGVIGFEAITHFCGGELIDPIPTVWHLLLLLAVPLGNTYLLVSMPQLSSKGQGLLAGGVMAISGFYALLFLPLLPVSIFAIIFFGMGLLPLSPILAFIASWRISRAWKKATPRPWDYRRGWWWGMGIVTCVFLILHAPEVWTRVQLNRAMGAGKEAAAAISTLRKMHSEDTLLNACYEGNRGTRQATSIASWLLTEWQLPAAMLGWDTSNNFDSEKAREVFFRVTGKPFNSLKPPRSTTDGFFLSPSRNTFDEWEFDDHLGGDDVAVRLKGLNLAESRMDTHIDGESAIGYGEWTMVFSNLSQQAKEARCQVRLPHEGRVSRLTLWVNGEPREAAFNSVAKVKAAYKEVAVVQRRDPVLVTMTGPDTVLVQCFPVPAGGKMKIRLGITAPCDGKTWELPRIIERNFGTTEDVKNAIWVQADRDFDLTSAPAAIKDGTGYSVQKTMPISTVLGSPLAIELHDISDLPNPVWCEDPFAQGEQKVLSRRATLGKDAPVERIIIVADGSAAMAPASEWLGKLASDHKVEILLATDGFENYQPGYSFTGGRDNEPALYEALSRARSSEHSAILWLHGPQPVKLSNAESLHQILERGTRHPALYDIEITPGPNRLADELGTTGLLKPGPKLTNPAQDIAKLINELRSGLPRIDYTWQRRATTEANDGQKVWDQLARLWAMQKAGTQAADSPQIAATYQLVTPVSGAVVLETKEQFEQHGLTPVDPSAAPSIPSIPEPSTTLLFLFATTASLLRRKRGI